MIEILALVLGSVVLGLLADEVGMWLSWVAKRLIHYEASKLPRQSERRREQWLADLEETPGNLGKLLYAVDLALRHPSLVDTLPADEPSMVSTANIASTAQLFAPSIATSTGSSSGTSTVIGIPVGGVSGQPLSVNVFEVVRMRDRRHPVYMPHNNPPPGGN